MKSFVVYLLVLAVLVWGVVELGSFLAKSQETMNNEKEECIVLKHQQDAKNFLDKNCSRFVDYKQQK